MAKAELVERPDFQEVQDELARAIRKERDDCIPHETARVLLSFDGPGQPLVGIRYDAERAVYYDEGNRDALAVFFDADGLDDRGARPITTLDGRVTLSQWVEKMRYYWSWTHPRFR